MKRTFDLDEIAKAEAFGALAVPSGHKHSVPGEIQNGLTPAQREAVSQMVRSLVKIARQAGAEKNAVALGDYSFEIHGNGTNESISICAHPSGD